MKRKILIASFLKPVNDIRSYEKIAKSLAENRSYEIYCLGYPSNIELTDSNIQFLPLSSFKKSGINRIIARWFVFKYYIKVKPQLIIVNSPDLLFFTILYKILFGGQIIYDIRENYYNNLWFQDNYNWGIKHILALIVRVKELVTAPLFDHFFLAEKVYTNQLKFIKNKFTILENKSLIPQNSNVKVRNTQVAKFLISGTIAKEYGVLEGINFFKSIAKTHSKSTLKIIGHCPNNSLLATLKLIAKTNSSINLEISSNPVAHIKIENEILNANIGLLPYQPNKSIEGKWPTKLYEYMAYKLPFIIQENSVWDDFIISNNAGIPFDFVRQSKQTCEPTYNTFCSKHFYIEKPSSSIFWKTEEVKLLEQIRNIIN